MKHLQVHSQDTGKNACNLQVIFTRNLPNTL